MYFNIKRKGNQVEEIWKDIKGYEGLYQVSNMGNVKSLDRKRRDYRGYANIKGQLKSLTKANNGYIRVQLSKNGIKNKKILKGGR